MSLLSRASRRISLLTHSIRFRLVLWFVLILSLVLGIFSGLLFYARVRELRAETINRLESKYEAVERLIGPDGLSSIDPMAILSARQPGGRDLILRPDDFLVIFGPDRSVAYFSGPIQQPPLLDLSHIETDPHEHEIEYKTFIGGHSIDMYGFLLVPAFSPGGIFQGFLVLGTSVDPRGELKRLLLTLLLLTALMLLFAFGGGFWLADRALRPVKTIADKARRIGETDLSERFNLQRKDEIGQLADTFDGMLGRLDAAFTRQRQFTADASHELRTPLTIVNLEASRALAAHRTSEEYKRALEVIRSENQLMSRLVSDLLTLARLDAGRELIHKEPLDLSDLAVEVIERLAPLAARLDVKLRSGDLPEAPVLGDREALIRLLSNLVENGVKYTSANPPGTPRQVMLETGISPDQSMAWARVVDSGPGISAEDQARLFDRFYRADKSRTRPRTTEEQEDPFPASSGLGLAIVQGIAQLHGGRVCISSGPGSGSTFELQLPLSSKV